MSTSYPGTIQTFSNPSGTSTLDSPDHAGLHTNLADTLGAAQAVMGTTAGTSVLKNFADGDFSTRINSSGVLQQTIQGTINSSTFGTPTVTGGTFASPSTTGTDSGTATLENKTLTSPTVTTPSVSSPTVTGTPVLDSDSAIPFYNDSISRQAIINGNFDVWQRGTSSTGAGGAVYSADRWFRYNIADGGSLPTLTESQGTITPGGLDNSFYYHRLTSSGASSSLGATARVSLYNKIEFGTRFLAGDGRKITISFMARSDISGKRLGAFILQGYGTGGSPTAIEVVNGDNFTLTSSWAKYSVTVELNTLTGKTFGTNNDDRLRLEFYSAWGDTFKTRVGASAVEDWAAGNIDIAQVQLCAGDVALPFQPKSFAQELLDCQRYYEKSFTQGVTPSNQTVASGQMVGSAYTNTIRVQNILFAVEKRTTPTITFYSDDNISEDSKWAYYNGSAWVAAVITNSDTQTSNLGTISLGVAGASDNQAYLLAGHWTADAEL